MCVRVRFVQGSQPSEATWWSSEGEVLVWVETPGCLRCPRLWHIHQGKLRAQRGAVGEGGCTHKLAAQLERRGCRWGLQGSRCRAWCGLEWFLCLGSDLTLVGAFLAALNVGGTILWAEVLDWIKGKMEKVTSEPPAPSRSLPSNPWKLSCELLPPHAFLATMDAVLWTMSLKLIPLGICQKDEKSN